MTGIQIILIIVVVTLTMLLVMVGIQVLFVIFGIKRLLKKIESKVDASEMIDSKFVSEQVSGVRNFFKKKFFNRN